MSQEYKPEQVRTLGFSFSEGAQRIRAILDERVLQGQVITQEDVEVLTGIRDEVLESCPFIKKLVRARSPLHLLMTPDNFASTRDTYLEVCGSFQTMSAGFMLATYPNPTNGASEQGLAMVSFCNIHEEGTVRERVLITPLDYAQVTPLESIPFLN